jgi:hypothetical protein
MKRFWMSQRLMSTDGTIASTEFRADLKFDVKQALGVRRINTHILYLSSGQIEL